MEKKYLSCADTAKLVRAALKKKFPKLDLQVITSELPDELRKQRIEEIDVTHPRVLIATDCLSEGVNRIAIRLPRSYRHL